MNYVKVLQEGVITYPYTLNMFSKSMCVSVGSSISEDNLAEYGVYPVFDVKPDVTEDQYLLQPTEPIFNEGTQRWELLYTVINKTDDQITSEFLQHKVSCKTEINTIRRTKENVVLPISLSSGNYRFRCNREQVILMYLKYQAISTGISSVPSYWRDYDNNNIPVIADDFKKIALEMDNYLMKIGEESHRVKDVLFEQVVTKEGLSELCEVYRNYDPLSP